MPSIISATTTSGLVSTADNSGDLQFQTQNGANTITLPSSSGTLATTANLSGLGFKNRIINGAMVIDQRNAGAAVTANGAFPVDRFNVSNGTDGAFSAQQDSSVPAGFIKSTKITITTADTSLAATQQLSFVQRIEGFNVADLNWGSANAKTVTLSFWVRSSLTGTFGGALRNNDANRSYPFTYSISVADTWEYKTVTIAGDTSGTWATDHNAGINLFFGLGAGTDRSGTAGAWNSDTDNSATGAVSVVGTINATWYITGVQLEVGSTATSFDYRPYTTELQLCQRYYETSGVISAGGYAVTITTGTNSISAGSTTANFIFGTLGFAVAKRTNPTMTINGTGGTANTVSIPWFGTDLNANSGALWTSGTYGFNLYNASGVTMTTGNFAVSFLWKASAEL